MSGTAPDFKSTESELKLAENEDDNSKYIEYVENGEYQTPIGVRLVRRIYGITYHTAAGHAPLKLDKYGVPLTPQPSDDPQDPCTSGFFTSFFS